MGLVKTLEPIDEAMKSAFHIDLKMKSGHLFRCYVLQVSYDPNLDTKFRDRHRYLQFSKSPNYVLEKSDARWMPAGF
jgi:hypothetical protein